MFQILGMLIMMMLMMMVGWMDRKKPDLTQKNPPTSEHTKTNNK